MPFGSQISQTVFQCLASSTSVRLALFHVLTATFMFATIQQLIQYEVIRFIFSYSTETATTDCYALQCFVIRLILPQRAQTQTIATDCMFFNVQKTILCVYAHSTHNTKLFFAHLQTQFCPFWLHKATAKQFFNELTTNKRLFVVRSRWHGGPAIATAKDDSHTHSKATKGCFFAVFIVLCVPIKAHTTNNNLLYQISCKNGVCTVKFCRCFALFCLFFFSRFFCVFNCFFSRFFCLCFVIFVL